MDQIPKAQFSALPKSELRTHLLSVGVSERMNNNTSSCAYGLNALRIQMGASSYLHSGSAAPHGEGVLKAEGGKGLEAQAPGESISGITAMVPVSTPSHWGAGAGVGRWHMCVSACVRSTCRLPFTGHLPWMGCTVRDAEKMWQAPFPEGAYSFQGRLRQATKR